MKKILVTGAAGFIGSHLCERLLEDGNDIVGIDDLSLGRMENINEIIHFQGLKFDFREIDILNIKNLDWIFQINKFDTVFHFAANSDISKGDPQNDIEKTLNTTLAILEKCREYEVNEIVFPSSGAIYGETSATVREDYGPLFPISHYAAAKLASEAFISAYSAMYGIKAWICRFPNVVGEHATHGAIFDFINKLNFDPGFLEVLGDGSQTKPYIYVKDLIEAMLFIWQNAKLQLNYFNIAGLGETSVREIAEMVIKEMGTKTEIHYTGGDRGWKGDVPRYRCDTSKLASLGWTPKLTSDEAVRVAIKKILNEKT
jgi:UDP-glucose 4-epimerase